MAQDEAGDAMLCFALANHTEDSELYPKSSVGPPGISEQKGKIRPSLLKRFLWVLGGQSKVQV